MAEVAIPPRIRRRLLAVFIASTGMRRDASGTLFSIAPPQGHLMKQSKYFSRWKPRYFKLEDGYLTYYDKKSLVGTPNKKVSNGRPREHDGTRGRAQGSAVRPASE